MIASGEGTPGRVVAGRYRLERVLGRGGMGVVWLAVDTLIERRVALKEMRAPAGVAEGDKASFVERALREARNAGRLNHPGVVAVHDVIAPTDDDDTVYIVMEYVESPTLAEIIDQQGPLPAPRVAAMGSGILDALMAAHAMGIVHRDIKPSNVLVRDGDRVKLTDFGIALAAEDTRLTRSGVVGTHAYLAPEAFDTGQVGPAADLWALGATLFHAVAGRPPFERDTTTATLRAILFENPPAPPCPPPLAEVITGLLTRPVDQRLTSDTAQQKLEQAATQPTAPTPDAPPGRGGWEAHATTVHRQPTQPGGQTLPGGPPVPFGTTPPMPPAMSSSPTQGGPAGFADPGSGQGLPRQPPPPPAPLPSGPWAGSAPRRNTTPLIIGGVIAAAAVLLLIVLAASGGSDSDGDGGEAGTDNSLPGGPSDTGDLGGGGLDNDTGSDAGSGGEDAEVVALEFLDSINRGDEGTALGMLCPDSRHATDVSEAIAGSATLELDAAVIDNSDTFQAGLDGTIDGETVTLGSISVENEDTGWCVLFFDVA